MKVVRVGNSYRRSFQGGPRHVLLGLVPGELDPAKAPVVALAHRGSCDHGPLDPARIRAAVGQALAEVEASTGHRVRLATIEYVPNDSPYYEMYYGHALAIAEVIAADQSQSGLPPGEQKTFASPFRLLLLTDVWDGEKDGIAVGREGHTYLFKMMDWDDQHHMRVFSLAEAVGTRWNEIEAALRFAGLKDGDRWVLPLSLPPDAESALSRLEASPRLLGVIASSDLLGDIAVWRPVSALPDPAPEQGWLGWLGLQPPAGGKQ